MLFRSRKLTGSTISDISLPCQNDEEEADEQQKDCREFSGTPMDLELETNAVFSHRALGGPVPLSWEQQEYGSTCKSTLGDMAHLQRLHS